MAANSREAASGPLRTPDACNSLPGSSRPSWPIAAAGGLDICLGGGVATVRQYLRAGLIDELHLDIRPVLLVRGASLERYQYPCIVRCRTDCMW